MLVEVSENGVCDNSEIKKSISVTLVANTRKTAVRIVTVPHLPKNGKLSQAEQWKLVKEHFPYGEKFNENTHVFDGSIFTNNNGQPRFFMTALPVSVCDEFTKAGIKLVGSIHRITRLETIEHILFREYISKSEPDESLFIFIPQDDGLRVLYIADCLPNAAHFISNHPDYREDEFLRFYNALEKPEKQRVIFHKDNGNFEWLNDLLKLK